MAIGRSGTGTILLIVLLLAGCASTPPWPAGPGGSTEGNLQNRHVLDNVPFYPQELYQCGPAALAMMLNTQGRDTDPDALVDRVYIPGREGTLQVELVAAARSYELLVYPLDGELTDLLTEVAAGNPVLVMQNLGFEWFPQWHFAVVIGFDPETENLILHTDTRKANEQPLSVFTKTWRRAGRWAVVMLPPDQLPATAKPLKFLRAANDLESTGHLDAAATAYRMASLVWPDQPAAWLGQGNIAYQQSDWPAAAEYYHETVKRFPNLAAGWNNLAYALDKNSCPDRAREAASCAAKLDTDRFGEPPQPNVSAEPGYQQCPTLSCPVTD